MRVLVLEQSDADFYLIERSLGEHFVVTRSSNLQEGLRIAASNRFDLMILELNLPDSQGYATFEKAHAALPHLAILILSSLEDSSLALRAVSDGAQDFVRKSRLADAPLNRIARYAIERSRAEERARQAERNYRVLLDNLPTAAFTCNAEGQITYFNRQAVEIWGRAPKLNDSADRFSGACQLLTADGAPLPKDQSWVALALRDQRAYDGVEVGIVQPNGVCRNALVHAHPIFETDGALAGSITVLIDITNQRRAERNVRESERFARSTVNSLGAHIAIVDEVGTILAVNSAWTRFGIENGSCSQGLGVGANYLDMCDSATGEGAEVARNAAAGIRRVIAREQEEFELEYPCHSPTEERWFIMRVTPFEGTGPTRVVVSHENITSRKVAERLASEQRGLREAVAGMEQVLGVVGHELRTPLAALRATSEFLLTERGRSSAYSERFLRAISDEVDRMSDMVNNLLEAARLNSGRAKWNWSEFDLAETVQDGIESVRSLVGSEVELIVNMEGPQETVWGDCDAIRRLLVNLLSNARKHTTQGHIEVGVCRYCDAEGTWVDLVVSDTGSGIPQQIVKRLGEAFALNSGVVGRNHISGTGLGLAICRGIVEAHGGELLIESVEGQGTTVTARFRADLQAAAQGNTEHLEVIEREAV